VGQRKLFCQRNKLFYYISLLKEWLKRDVKDLFSGEKIAGDKSTDVLPEIVKAHRSVMVRKLLGVDLELQYNKITNLKLASDKINGVIINPGEIFSFWKLVGRPSKRKGYLKGLTISSGKLSSGTGGGLCQLANLIHWLILNSPLEVTELYHHSDALFPDERRRVPFGTGTGVFYKNIDYRFKNTSDQKVQLLLWMDENDLCGELRTEKPFPFRYKITEENHHYRKEGDSYYRISQIYRITYSKESNEEISKELILDNHSKVMYDPAYIPADEIVTE
jgi:vancomycin resistance protein VanW